MSSPDVIRKGYINIYINTNDNNDKEMIITYIHFALYTNIQYHVMIAEVPSPNTMTAFARTNAFSSDSMRSWRMPNKSKYSIFEQEPTMGSTNSLSPQPSIWVTLNMNSCNAPLMAKYVTESMLDSVF